MPESSSELFRSANSLHHLMKEAVRELPADRQDMAGELLLAVAAQAPKYCLTNEQLEDLKMSIEEANRGEFASESEMAETWKKFGL